MAIPVKLQVFEGPLDLLLHLIEKNKIDIYDIPIVVITEQYLEYIRNMERQDLGIMSEFMVMAATLIDIKCRMLLPKEVTEDGEEVDPREELVQRLLDYKTYKFYSYELRTKLEEAAGIFYKGQTIPKEVLKYEIPVDPAELVAGITLEHLHKIFEDVMRRQEDRRDPIRSTFGKIEQEEVNLPEKIKALKDYARLHSSFSFRELIGEQKSRVQMIVTFLAILELMKIGNLRVTQEGICEEIEIEVCCDPEEWDDVLEGIE